MYATESGIILWDILSQIVHTLICIKWQSYSFNIDDIRYNLPIGVVKIATSIL